MSGENVLVVEDNVALLNALRMLLERGGYAVSTAANGLEGLQVMADHLPDLILADINMPVMNGYDFYEAVRANPAWRLAPFVFLTARAEREDILRGRALGAEDYLVKPLDSEELLTVVRARLERAHVVLESRDVEVQQIREQITQTLSHELRTPLTWIIAYTELTRDYLDTLSPDEVRDFLGHVLDGGDRITRLTNDLLTLIRLDDGRYKEELRALLTPCDDVSRVAQRVVDERRAAASAKGVELQANVHPPLPEVVVSEDLLGDALGRLVDNAVKFSTGPDKVVEVTTRAADGFVEISVVDQGIGIKAADLPHLFSRFRQLDREKTEQQGVGLGLALAGELVSLHGGEIVVQSAPGAGSTFTIRLPART